jgi:hypothetical protein
MFGGLFASVFGKIAAVVVTLAGLTGGLAATGSLPMLSGIDIGSSPVALAGGPAIALPLQPGTPLSFPDLPTLHQGAVSQQAQELAAAASAQAISVANQAQGTAQKGAAAAQKCLDSLAAQVNSLVAGIPSITNQEQAAAMVAQARTIGDAATACAKKATALGQKGVDQITKAASQLNTAVAQIGALDLKATTDQVVQGAQNTVGAATQTVDKASTSAFGMFQQITDMAAALMATAMEYQQKVQGAPPAPAGNNPVPSLPSTPTTTNPTNPFGGFGAFGAWMEFAAQMQQTYGTGSTDNTGWNTSGWDNDDDDDRRRSGRR